MKPHLYHLWDHLYLPSGKLTELWKITIFNGKIHYKWSFSIAMLVYQRVYVPLTTECKSFFFSTGHGILRSDPPLRRISGPTTATGATRSLPSPCGPGRWLCIRSTSCSSSPPLQRRRTWLDLQYPDGSN
jgi:hypothetical protein